MIAIIAAALPGVDPVSMLIEMVPLLVLFELSILLARASARPSEGGVAEPTTQERWGEADGAGDEQRMVFDIRGQAPHVVKFVYAMLAILMGSSLFLVIGPVNPASLFGNSTSTTSAAHQCSKNSTERLERKVRKEPENPDLLLALTQRADQRRQPAGQRQRKRRSDRTDARVRAELQRASGDLVRIPGSDRRTESRRRPGGGPVAVQPRPAVLAAERNRVQHQGRGAGAAESRRPRRGRT